jgi:hypothetical protein
MTRKAFDARAGLAVFIFIEALVALQTWLAYQDHFLTVSKMQGRGVNFGLPFAYHFGMWGDIFIVSPLVAYVTGRYSSRWRLHRMLLSLALGIAAVVAMSRSYTLPDFQEAHAQGHRLTPAGIASRVYGARTGYDQLTIHPDPRGVWQRLPTGATAPGPNTPE